MAFVAKAGLRCAPLGQARTSLGWSSAVRCLSGGRTQCRPPSLLSQGILPRSSMLSLSVSGQVFGHHVSRILAPSILSRIDCRTFHQSSRSQSTSSDDRVTAAQLPPEPTSKWVGYHSLFLAFLVYAIVVVGGLTRLTESGLSITEWNPGFKGMWLPSTDEQWEGEWAKYRETPEFLLLNSRMSLDDFKTIYMWEWSHRILGRVIGMAYILPAAFFVARGMVKSPFRSKLLLIGLGIGAQGAMGWYMVKSGLAAPQGSLHIAPDSDPSQPHSDALAPPELSTPASWTPRVSHFRLAAHLGLAFLVYAGMLRTGLSVLREYNLAKNVGSASGLRAGAGVRSQLVDRLSQPSVRRYHRFTGAVTGLVFLTAMSGALVAGLDAGLVYNEFPTMGDGRIAPPLDEMFDERYARQQDRSREGEGASNSSLILHNLTQNPVTVQFVHRCLAITTFAHVVALAWRTRSLQRAVSAAGKPLPPAVPRLAYAALATATMQATLGITTLIYMVPIELASAHQAGSVALLSVMLALWGTLRVPLTGHGMSMTAAVKQAAAVTAAASTGSATAASAAGGSPHLARATRTLHTAARCMPSSIASTQRRHYRTLADLPEKVRFKTGPTGRLAKVLPPREASEITTRVGSSYGGNHSIQWLQPPRNIFIVTKRHDGPIVEALARLIEHINVEYPDMNVIVEGQNAAALQSSHQTRDKVTVVREEEAESYEYSTKSLLASKVDLVVTLGGDGTILHASSLFDQSPVPPVLSFSIGTLGFLLPWHIDSFKKALADVVASKVTLLLRMRLKQTVHHADGSLVQSQGAGHGVEETHLMNEVTLHRGRQPHMTTIDAFVDGKHLTQAISDGLIIASPTGSTAYSLSAGGPIVHPSVQSLLLTPICPRSLSFRPVLLPSDSTIQLKVSPHSRSPAEITIDGRDEAHDPGAPEPSADRGAAVLRPGQFLQISMSPFPIPCINRSSTSHQAGHVDQPEPRLIEAEVPSSSSSSNEAATVATASDRGEDDWVGDINRLLRFNASFAGRGLLGGTTHDDEHGGGQ